MSPASRIARVAVAALLLGGSLFATAPAPRPQVESKKFVRPEPRKLGRWHMAESGHAVYCYGPVVTLNVFTDDREPKRYATECRGASRMVPLHD